ncbi:MAG: FmdB family zinc ribbon protein [Dehalococcoidales bacterium]
MPIYEYFCPLCKSKFELLRSVDQANADANCPQCQTPSSKVLSQFACYTKDSSGSGSTVGGRSCSACTSTDCGSCGK